MILTVKREHYSIELEAKGPEMDFVKAWIVKKGNYHEVDCDKIIAALDRRSECWLESALEAR